ncbi:MAG: GNAT family N-acetyltransferase [candidate division Zixibacteria bacterium CG_4_9_14_3_um_filter_46_8]|nr:MAG: GNAT family N-acetyltransferase [candidate division Zixibacteria bacterium CG_4_9_14_3_um_filter_46_8]
MPEMAKKQLTKNPMNFHPVTSDRWKDMDQLFGSRGACGGCWCMVWRSKRAEFEELKGEGNRNLMKKLIESGEIPGILGYYDGEPIAWCSVAPREKFPALERSRIFKKIDDKPVWSIVCLFIRKDFRQRGISNRTIKEALDYASSMGAEIVEAYPFEPGNKLPDSFVWTGIFSAYLKAGFEVAIRRSASRPMMRYIIDRQQKSP